MTAVALLDRTNRFLADNALVDQGFRQQSFQVVWQSPPDDPMAGAVEAIEKALSPPVEVFERAEPSPQAVLVARLTGQPLAIAQGSILKRKVWTLTDEQLPTVADWLDRYDSAIAMNSVSAFANRHVIFRWNPIYRGDNVEMAEPNMLGIVLSHPRHIQVPLHFYDAEHYYKIKHYMELVGLPSFLDKCVLPKGSLVGKVTERAG